MLQTGLRGPFWRLRELLSREVLHAKLWPLRIGRSELFICCVEISDGEVRLPTRRGDCVQLQLDALSTSSRGILREDGSVHNDRNLKILCVVVKCRSIQLQPMLQPLALNAKLVGDDIFRP